MTAPVGSEAWDDYYEAIHDREKDEQVWAALGDDLRDQRKAEVPE